MKPSNTIAVLSMLHEPAHRASSAQRMFRDEPVLAWTLRRLAKSKQISRVTILCWADQQSAVASIAEKAGTTCCTPAPRSAMPQIESIAASRRWADGWRGGLLAACEFDRGFHGGWVAQILHEQNADAALLVDPAAALVDPELVDGIIAHAQSNPDVDFYFSPAAPGLSGVLVRRQMVDQLAAGAANPGMLLAYRPDLPQRDPISTPACVTVPAGLARTTTRFTLDSQRQIQRISVATAELNGQLIETPAAQLLRLVSESSAETPLPRELVLELTTRRNTRPIYLPVSHLNVQRGDISLELAKKAVDELAAADDARLILSGVGDPLLHPDIFEIIQHANRSGVALAIETDLLGIDAAAIDRLASSPIDIISVFVPAASARTYQAVMGIDAAKPVMENLCRLIERQRANNRGVPLIVPTFIKTNLNLAEMEPWYDHWLRTLRCAVISGPGDYAGQIPDCGAAQMEPPLRKPCSRLASRLTILSDGRAVSCEQDVLGHQSLGNIAQDSISSIWKSSAAALRADHAGGRWSRHRLCAGCQDWHRP